MSRKMLINATHPEENRVAIVEEGLLSELDIEVVGREQTRGNIYKACVVRVEQGLQAAFVDYGAERLGFLQIGELHPSLFKAADPAGERKGKLRINDVLRRGQELLVQVVKGERGTKGAALTTHLSLAGRYMVLVPESDSKGVSRKIEAEGERKKLKEAMSSLDLPDNMGYIVRTAGIGQSREELKRDFDYLVRVYENILSLSQKAKAPALIYKESNLVIRSIRDYFTADIDEVLVDDPKVAQEAKEFFQQVMPECVKLVKLHQERRPIFSRYQIEEQIESIYRNKINLPSGGSIVIDRTEALVAIDVNSGKLAGEQGVEATAFRTNMEAAEEVARQLRLRDLGGLIVVDFIDMRERKHERDVEKCLKEAMKKDKARVSVGKISQFGLLELSRQRIKDALAEGTFLICPHCDGSGRIKSPDAQAVAFLRKVQTGVAKGQIGRVEAELPVDVAMYLLNNKRHELTTLESAGQYEIVIKGRLDLVPGQVELNFVRREKEDELYLQPVVATDHREDFVVAAPSGPHAPPESSEQKKRSRKKKSDAASDLPLTGTDIMPPSTLTEEVHVPVLPDETEELSAEAVGEDGTRKKRKRRRKKKKTGISEAGEPIIDVEESRSDDTASDAAEERDSEEESSDDAPVAEKKRKRRRKRKKKGLSASIKDESGTLPDAIETTAEPAVAVIGDAPAASNDPDGTQNKRKRKRRKKTATEPQVEPSPGSAAAEGAAAEIEMPVAIPPILASRDQTPPPSTVTPSTAAPATAEPMAVTKTKTTRKKAISAPNLLEGPDPASPTQKPRARKSAAIQPEGETGTTDSASSTPTSPTRKRKRKAVSPPEAE